jgi:hypothetical protein
MTTNYAAYIEPVATHYLGNPTKRSGDKVYYGNKFSKVIDKKAGTFFDHELGEGGGVMDMIRMHEGASLQSIADIAEKKFNISKRVQPALERTLKRTTEHSYYDADGVEAYQVIRIDEGGKKTYRQRRPDGNGGWIWSVKDIDPLPYNLPDILTNPDKTIYIVEGEKAADALKRYSVITSTNHGGAGNWKPELNAYFAGRNVVVIPDNDEAGDKHAIKVINELLPVAKAVKRVDLPNLPDKGDAVDWLDAGNTIEQLRELVKNALKIESKVDEPPAKILPILGLSELRNMPPVKWLVDGVITKHGFSALYGAPGVGKSFIALDIALSVAYGRAWHDRTVDGGKVLYIAGEGVGGLGKRVKAWETHYGLNDNVPLQVVPKAVQFRDEADIQELIDTIDHFGGGYRLIVIDTVARSMVGMEENSSSESGIFVAACDRIRTHADCALLAIHHSGKDASRGMRGSNALLGAVDTSLQVKAAGKENVLMHVEKQKDAEPVPDMQFAFEKVALISDDSAVIKLTEKKVKNDNDIKVTVLDEEHVELYNLLKDLISKSEKNYVDEKVFHEAHNLLWAKNGKNADAPSRGAAYTRRTRAREHLTGHYIKFENKRYSIIRGLDGNLTEDDLF